ncbi:Kae1-associated serine/threonine protein kinase, partial [Candidatus Woesearchaeota archaeon]|nr:Kae1-associated serine/threonine protein kinase [Candidatus Woesearchaeota archaeon]
MNKIIGKGAEATITLENSKVIKERQEKKYRHPQLDKELRKTRTKKEAKIMQKIPGIAPNIIETDNESKIIMEHINGPLLKDILDANIKLAKEIGNICGQIHDKNIIHGDLTTSNIILQQTKNHEQNSEHEIQNFEKIRFIDFGLSQISTKEEDKAVDLHLFKEAVESKHYKYEKEIWKKFLEGY